uniref:Fas-associated factor 1/2-like UAS domain-containing protein n=1 Tax=Ditylenchus dipsaci TaxID=166011 RepID=A0A915DR26_9BILA
MSDTDNKIEIVDLLESEESDEGEDLVDTFDSYFDDLLVSPDEEPNKKNYFSLQNAFNSKTVLFYYGGHAALFIGLQSQIMCSEAVSSALKSEFVVWAWDMSEKSSQLYEWLSCYEMIDVSQKIKHVPISRYPLLVVLVKSGTNISPVSIIQG